MNTDAGRKFAVITGGSTGIGYEFARVCAEENFEILIVADYGADEAAERLRPAALRSRRFRQTCRRSRATKASPRRSCSEASRWTSWP